MSTDFFNFLFVVFPFLPFDLPMLMFGNGIRSFEGFFNGRGEGTKDAREGGVNPRSCVCDFVFHCACSVSDGIEKIKRKSIIL